MNPNTTPASAGNLLTEVYPGTYYMDSRRLNSLGFSGAYILVDEGITLIETGTSLIAPRIIDVVLDQGFRERDIHSAVVTHIHLDHAGGAGWLTGRLPHMKIFVHERGYPHLADPSRLLRSAEAVYGSFENIVNVHGDILPVPEKNLVSVKDETIKMAGGRELRVFDTPGHAPHHLGVFDPEAGAVFCGEALGIYLPESDLLYPAAAPPVFNCRAVKTAIRRIRDLNPKHMLFSQFGPHPDAMRALDGAERQVDYYDAFLRIRYNRGQGLEDSIRDLAKDIFESGAELDWGTESMLRSMVLGYRGWFEKGGAAD